MSKQPQLRVLHGSAEETAAVLVGKLLGASPSITWCEPKPRETRLDKFPGLWIGTSDEQLKGATIELDEARLFWPNGWVHVVAAGNKARWAAFVETPTDKPSAWLDQLPKERAEEKPWDVQRQSLDLLLMQKRDLIRFDLAGFVGAFDGKHLRVIEYHQDTALVGWRLEPNS